MADLIVPLPIVNQFAGLRRLSSSMLVYSRIDGILLRKGIACVISPRVTGKTGKGVAWDLDTVE